MQTFGDIYNNYSNGNKKKKKTGHENRLLDPKFRTNPASYKGYHYRHNHSYVAHYTLTLFLRAKGKEEGVVKFTASFCSFIANDGSFCMDLLSNSMYAALHVINIHFMHFPWSFAILQTKTT